MKSHDRMIRRLLGCALMVGVAQLSAQTLLYRWSFNSETSGTTVTPDASVGGGGVLTMNYGGTETDLYSPIGGGVSGGGIPNDRCLANHNSIYGNASLSGIAATTPGNMNIGVLDKFTITGWVNADGGFDNIPDNTYSRLFLLGAGTPIDTGSPNSATLTFYKNLFAWHGQGTNAIQLRLGGPAGSIGGPYGGDGAIANNFFTGRAGWVFMAVSVDLTLSSNNVVFYVGDPASSTTLFSTTYYNNGGAPIGSIDFGSAAYLALLNRNDRNRAFDGWGDDFRLYSGVLGIEDLEMVRLEAVPEPKALLLLPLLFVLVYRVRQSVY